MWPMPPVNGRSPSTGTAGNGAPFRPRPPPGTTRRYRLNAVAAISSNDVWAVGGDTDFLITAIIEHWDGKAWSLVPSPTYVSSNDSGGAYRLNAVAAISTSDVWAVGDDNRIEHWNGT